jgi:hypothetical protein
MNGMSSEFFCDNVGVRQGENASPFLFSIYINDLEEEFFFTKKMLFDYKVLVLPLKMSCFCI